MRLCFICAHKSGWCLDSVVWPEPAWSFQACAGTCNPQVVTSLWKVVFFSMTWRWVFETISSVTAAKWRTKLSQAPSGTIESALLVHSSNKSPTTAYPGDAVMTAVCATKSIGYCESFVCESFVHENLHRCCFWCVLFVWILRLSMFELKIRWPQLGLSQGLNLPDLLILLFSIERFAPLFVMTSQCRLLRLEDPTHADAKPFRRCRFMTRRVSFDTGVDRRFSSSSSGERLVLDARSLESIWGSSRSEW